MSHLPSRTPTWPPPEAPDLPAIRARMEAVPLPKFPAGYRNRAVRRIQAHSRHYARLSESKRTGWNPWYALSLRSRRGLALVY